MKCLCLSLLLHLGIIALIFGPFRQWHNVINEAIYIKTYTVSKRVVPINNTTKTLKAAYKNIMPVVQNFSLLTFLHDQIQGAISNSDLIDLVNNKEATIEFVLTPNGQIQNIKLINKTGLIALDQMIIDAVKNTAPIPKKLRLTKSNKFALRIYLQ